MKIRTLVTGAAALLVAVSLFAQVRQRTDATDQRPDPVVGVQEALALSAAQVESLRALLTARMQSSEPIFQEIQAKREALRTLQNQPSPNATDVGNAVAAVQAAEARLKAIHDTFLADFDRLLTSDQRKLVDDTRAAAGRIAPLAQLGIVAGGPQSGPGGRGGRGGPGPRGPRL